MSDERLEAALRQGPPNDPPYEPVLADRIADVMATPHVEPVRRVDGPPRRWPTGLETVAAALATMVVAGVLAAALLLRAPVGPPTAPTVPPSAETKRTVPGQAFLNTVGDWFDRTGSGVSVGVALDEQLYLMHRGFISGTGVNRIGPGSRFALVAVVLQLVDEGALGLDDTLGEHGVEWPDADTITVRMLLSGSSGVAPFAEPVDDLLARIDAEPERAWGPADGLAIAAAAPPRFAPGAGVGLVDTDDALLATIVEEVTGRPAAEIMRERVIDRLGLNGIFTYEEAVPLPGEAQDPGRNPGQYELVRAIAPGSTPGNETFVEDIDPRLLAVLGPARGMGATGPELTRLVDALHQGTFDLLPAPQRDAFSTAFEDGGFAGRWACPCAGSVARALVVEGNVGLYASYVAWFPADEVTIALVMNSVVPVDAVEDLVEEVEALIEP